MSCYQMKAFFLRIAASVAAAAAVNPIGIKTFLASGLSIFPIKGNPVFSKGPENLYKNALDWPILCTWVFDNFILVDEPFAKALLVKNNLCGKLFSSLESPTTFKEVFKVTSVQFFIPDFNLLSCQFDSFTKVLYWMILYWYHVRTK